MKLSKLKRSLSKMDEMLMNPDNIDGMQVYEDYEQLKIKHDEALASWEKQTPVAGKANRKKKIVNFRIMGRIDSG